MGLKWNTDEHWKRTPNKALKNEFWQRRWKWSLEWHWKWDTDKKKKKVCIASGTEGVTNYPFLSSKFISELAQWFLNAQSKLWKRHDSESLLPCSWHKANSWWSSFERKCTKYQRLQNNKNWTGIKPLSEQPKMPWKTRWDLGRGEWSCTELPALSPPGWVPVLMALQLNRTLGPPSVYYLRNEV